jgi:hypothetical protein
MVPNPSARASVVSAVVAFAFLGAAALALHEDGVSGLAAASNYGRTDHDRDGLSDLQELVYGTLPYRRDSDGDSFSDLEELARDADPVNFHSRPEPMAFGLGTCASQENGFVSLVSAVYLDETTPPESVVLEIGLVYRGRILKFAPQSYVFSRGYFHTALDSRDTLAVLEIGVPDSLLRRLGQLNMFSILSSSTDPTAEPIVGLLPLVDFSGIATLVRPSLAGTSNNGGGATGVVYRPLAGDDQIPSTWSGGEICFQRTSAVGMNGASVVHEVEGADCLPMDTYCSPADCAGGVGTPLELPDPAALVGG